MKKLFKKLGELFKKDIFERLVKEDTPYEDFERNYCKYSKGYRSYKSRYKSYKKY